MTGDPTGWAGTLAYADAFHAIMVLRLRIAAGAVPAERGGAQSIQRRRRTLSFASANAAKNEGLDGSFADMTLPSGGVARDRKALKT